MRTYSALCIAASLTAPSLLSGQVLDQGMLPTSTLSLVWYAVTDPGTSNATANGAGVTWDFTSADLVTIGTASMMPASETPFFNQFPFTQWALMSAPDGGTATYDYLVVSATGMEFASTGVPSSQIIYINTRKILQFPLSLGESFSDTWQNFITDETGTDEWTYAGNGTILSALPPVANVVKMQDQEGRIIFWNTEPLYPMIFIDEDGIFAIGPDISASIGEERTAVPMIHPNPARDRFQLEGVVGPAEWAMYDMLGRTVKTGRTASDGPTNIAVDDLQSGTYRLLVLQNGKQWSLPFVRE